MKNSRFYKTKEGLSDLQYENVTIELGEDRKYRLR